MRLRRAGEQAGERAGGTSRRENTVARAQLLDEGADVSPSAWVCGEAADGSMSVVASNMRENVVDNIRGIMRNISHVRGAHLLVVLSSTTRGHLQVTSTTLASGVFIVNHYSKTAFIRRV